MIALASYSEALLRFTETKLYSQHVDVKTLSAHLRKVEQILSVNSTIGVAQGMFSQIWGLLVRLSEVPKTSKLELYDYVLDKET